MQVYLVCGSGKKPVIVNPVERCRLGRSRPIAGKEVCQKSVVDIVFKNATAFFSVGKMAYSFMSYTGGVS